MNAVPTGRPSAVVGAPVWRRTVDERADRTGRTTRPVSRLPRFVGKA